MSTKVVSWSELDSYRQCPFKWQLGYQERWVSPTTSLPLERGSLWHVVLEAHYNTLKALQGQGKGSGRSPKADSKALWDAVAPHLYGDGGKQTETQELIEWMYRGYVEHHGTDDDWQIVAVEHGFRIWLPTLNGGRSQFLFKGKIDLIVKVRVAGRWTLWLVDHKSGKDLPSQKMLDLDDQFGLYTWAMKKLGKKVLGSIHNAARTQRNKTGGQTLESRHSRTMMNRTDRELDAIVQEAYLDFLGAHRPRTIDQPRHTNPDSCRWRCNFLEACLSGRKGYPVADHLLSTGYRQDFTRHE